MAHEAEILLVEDKKTHIYCMFNAMTADGLVMQGAKASVTMALI